MYHLFSAPFPVLFNGVYAPCSCWHGQRIGAFITDQNECLNKTAACAVKRPNELATSLDYTPNGRKLQFSPTGIVTFVGECWQAKMGLHCSRRIHDWVNDLGIVWHDVISFANDSTPSQKIQQGSGCCCACVWTLVIWYMLGPCNNIQIVTLHKYVNETRRKGAQCV